MKKILFSGAAVLALSFPSLHAAELLLNGTFEAQPLTTAGDHIGVVPTNWLVATNATATPNSNLSNHVRGTITGTGTGVIIVTPATPLAPYPGDTTGGNSQSLDGNGQDVTIYQDFTMTLNSRVNVSIAFGGRDGNSLTGSGSTWQILDPANSYAVVAQLGSTIKPTNGSWTASNTVSSVALVAGKTYRFAINLGDPDMVDAASITPVPEPSTYAGIGVGVGLLAWLGAKRRRMA